MIINIELNEMNQPDLEDPSKENRANLIEKHHEHGHDHNNHDHEHGHKNEG